MTKFTVLLFVRAAQVPLDLRPRTADLTKEVYATFKIANVNGEDIALGERCLVMYYPHYFMGTTKSFNV